MVEGVIWLIPHLSCHDLFYSVIQKLLICFCYWTQQFQVIDLNTLPFYLYIFLHLWSNILQILNCYFNFPWPDVSVFPTVSVKCVLEVRTLKKNQCVLLEVTHLFLLYCLLQSTVYHCPKYTQHTVVIKDV